MPNEEVDLVSAPMVFSVRYLHKSNTFMLCLICALESAGFIPDPLRKNHWAHTTASLRMRLDPDVLDRGNILVAFETERQTVAVGVCCKEEWHGPTLAEMQNRIKTWAETWVTTLSK